MFLSPGFTPRWLSPKVGGVHLLPDLFDSLALNDPLAYFAVFLGVSFLMLWRLEAMLDHGLEGTALGTLLMPYCSGLGNLIFVWLMIRDRGAPAEVLTNCLVNNVTNLTLLLGLPALCWGLAVLPLTSGKGKKPVKPAKAGKDHALEGRLNRLSLLLTLAAVMFFTGAVWALGADGELSRNDGLVLIGLFLFWQCFQVYDVMKHNLTARVSFRLMFYVDVLVVLVCAYLMYESLDALVTWLSSQKHGFFSAANLGWLTGWLMVLPNAVVALFWAWKKRADIVYSSQVGDGHICIPLCLGLFALARPLPIAVFAASSFALLLSATALHGVLLICFGGLPRWAGGALVVAYGWFVYWGVLA